MKLTATGSGSIKFVCNDTVQKYIAIHNVFYVPKLSFNLLSVSQLCRDKKITVKFDAEFAQI
jgi:hypothetical protein